MRRFGRSDGNARHQVDQGPPGGVRSRLASGVVSHRELRRDPSPRPVPPRPCPEPARSPGAPQRRIAGDRRGDGEEQRCGGEAAEGRSIGAQAGHPVGRSGRTRVERSDTPAAVGPAQHAACDEVPDGSGRECQRGGQALRRPGRPSIFAPGSISRSAKRSGPHGLRYGGGDFGRPLRGPEGRAGPPRARSRPVHARPPYGRARLHGALRSLPGSRRGHVRDRQSARSSPTTCSRPPTAAGSSRPPRFR